MDQHEKPKPHAHTGQAKEDLSPEERSLLSILLPSPATRDEALAALGDQDRRFNLLAREFNLRSTYSFVEDPSIDAGTSYFKVDPATLKVPSVQEVSILLSRTQSSGPEEVAVSLMCLFRKDTPVGDVERMEKVMQGFGPETSSSSPPTVSISFQAPRVDVVTRLEAVLEALHKPCGLHPNMPLPTMTGELLRLPEINRRAIEIFQKKALDTGETYLHNGLPEDRGPFAFDSLMTSSIQALGKIALFEAREQNDLESLADRVAGPVSCLLDSIVHHQGGGFRSTAECMESLMHEFEATRDLQGMCGLACLLTLQRQDAITAEHDIFPDFDEESPLDSDVDWWRPNEYDRLLNLSLDTLSEVATTPDELSLAHKIVNALKAESELFDRNLVEINQELEDTRETFQIPGYAQNNFLLARAVHDTAKPAPIQDVFTELLPVLSHLGEDKGASLITFGIMNPELRGPILEVIDAEGLVSSPALLIEKVHYRVKHLVPSQAGATITQTVNYLADELAVALDVAGYQLGNGVYREK
jgi:hypothetical protein